MTNWNETIQNLVKEDNKPVILNRVQKPLYEYTNISAPTCEGWWWVWTGDHWEPCFVETLNGEPMVFLWGEKIEKIGGFLLDDLDARCRFTGPIQEPPKP